MNAPQTSIVVPTCDRPGLLPRAIASVLAQSSADWELLVVNDGTAPLDAVIAAYPDPRIRWLKTAGRIGVSAARNQGIRQARGEVIGLLDDDDSLAPDFIAQMAAFMRTRQLDFAWCGIVRLDAEGREEKRRVWTVDSAPESRLDFLLEAAASCGLSFSRQALQRFGAFDESLRTSEDRELFLRWIAAGARYAALPEPLVQVHAHASERLSDVRHDRARALASAGDDEALMRRYADLIGRDAAVAVEYRYHLAGKYFHARHAAGFWRIWRDLRLGQRLNLKLLRRALRVLFWRD